MTMLRRCAQAVFPVGLSATSVLPDRTTKRVSQIAFRNPPGLTERGRETLRVLEL